MTSSLKEMLKQTTVYQAIRDWRDRRIWARHLADWERNGRPNPPPHLIKQAVIRKYAQQHGTRVFVETGTFHGDMVAVMRKDFDRLYSIELSSELFNRAKLRFARYPKVEIIQGDSGVELGKLMHRIREPTLFWLDGHYSAGETARGDRDTPILAELSHIYGSGEAGHVVIIDDARCFGLDRDYPTIDKLREHVLSMRQDVQFEVENDSIRITPRHRQVVGV